MTDLLSGRRIFGNNLKRFIENSPELSFLYGSLARPFILFLWRARSTKQTIRLI